MTQTNQLKPTVSQFIGKPVQIGIVGTTPTGTNLAWTRETNLTLANVDTDTNMVGIKTGDTIRWLPLNANWYYLEFQNAALAAA